MTIAQAQAWPEPAILDDDALCAAGRPDLAWKAMRKVLTAVMPTVSDEYLFAETGRGLQATAWMRQCGMYLLAGRLGLPVNAVAREMERHRTSVLHAVRLVQAKVADSAGTAAFLDFLESQLVEELRLLASEAA